jgi:hypothetical protein
MLKAFVRRGHLALVISEMARGGYRTGDRSTDTSALAAGKESGGIEYGAALLLGLRSVKGENNLTDVEVAKNRLGGAKPEFRIRLDRDRAEFVEVPMPAAEEQREAKEDAKDAKARARVIEAVKSKELRTKDELVIAAGGRRSETWRAMTKLLLEGTLVQVAGVFRLHVSEAV